MKKRVFVSILKEIRQSIEEWTEEEFQERLENGHLNFKKFLPSKDDWNRPVAHTVKIELLEEMIED